MLSMPLAIALSGCLLVTTTTEVPGQSLSIRATGAVPDGTTLCTQAIQSAVDQTHAAGGGTVFFPPGKWLSGTIFLKDNVTLHLDAGATLLGSADLKDYPEVIAKVRSRTDPYVKRMLISAEDLHDVAIRGRGTIDGQGAKFLRQPHFERPYILRMVNCRDILIEDVYLCASPMWMQHYLNCDRLYLRGVRVFNHAGRNNDGLDIDGCHDVRITDCILDAEDDALCIKGGTTRGNENIVISNCILSSHAVAVKMGTETNGGLKNLSVANCTISSPRHSKVLMPSGEQRGRTGIDLMIVDGGTLDGVAISNVTIDGVSSPICLRLGNRAQPVTPDAPKPPVGAVRNLTFSHIIATRASRNGCPITGIPGHPIENLTLNNVRMEFEGGGTTEDAARAIPELENAFPKSVMFGTLPAYGLWFRHVKNLRLLNVQHALTGPDARPAMIFDDVEDVLVDGQKPRQVRPTSMTAE